VLTDSTQEQCWGSGEEPRKSCGSPCGTSCIMLRRACGCHNLRCTCRCFGGNTIQVLPEDKDRHSSHLFVPQSTLLASRAQQRSSKRQREANLNVQLQINRCPGRCFLLNMNSFGILRRFCKCKWDQMSRKSGHHGFAQDFERENWTNTKPWGQKKYETSPKKPDKWPKLKMIKMHAGWTGFVELDMVTHVL